MSDQPKRYRLTLDFVVSINDEILQPYSDEDELDNKEKKALKAQRALLRGLLHDQRGLREELIRKRVLEEADGAVSIYELRDQLLMRNLSDELLLEPIIDRLSGTDWEYFQEAIDDERFEEAAGEAIYSIGVDLEGTSLVEVDEEEKSSPDTGAKGGSS